MSKEVGAGGRFDIFLDSEFSKHLLLFHLISMGFRQHRTVNHFTTTLGCV